jgi:hypothetical protein
MELEPAMQFDLYEGMATTWLPENIYTKTPTFI